MLVRCALFALALAAAPLAAQETKESVPPLPEYTILRAAGPIAADGRLDEASWRAAPRIDEFAFPWWSAGEKERTEARLLWDEEALYVAFEARDHHISAVFKERDDPVSRDDCVEVFVAPDPGEVGKYFNFEFNALGTLLDRSPRQQRRKEWNAAGIVVGVRIEGTLNDESDQDCRWTTEIAIPFSAFSSFAPRLPPAGGDTWRLNLYRTGGKVDLQYMAWSDTRTPQPQFHVPERFGIVHFSTRPAALPAAGPSRPAQGQVP